MGPAAKRKNCMYRSTFCSFSVFSTVYFLFMGWEQEEIEGKTEKAHIIES